MRRTSTAPAIIALLPSLALIPVLYGVISGIHGGGIKIIVEFISAALRPSTDPLVIQNAWYGLQVTIATALISWVISTFAGILLGICSSRVVWRTCGGPDWIALLIRRCLAIPRAIHEMLWGLILLQIFGVSPWIAIVAISVPYASLVARVLSDQLDAIDINPLTALIQSGSKPFQALLTALGPPMIPVIISYCGYRLECALRGATLLGLFGMGGIGTELQFTMESLEFQEMWTSLWMLAGVMFSLEQAMSWWRLRISSTRKQEIGQLLNVIPLIMLATGLSLFWLMQLDVNLLTNISWHPISLPTIKELQFAYQELPWFELVGDTLLLTILSAGIAIGTPILGLMLWPHKLGRTTQSICWALLRLIPPKLSALLLLLCSSPNIALAALALGAHNLGVMGRLLKEGLDQQSKNCQEALQSSGAGPRATWLYGSMSMQSHSYLAYAAYRTDVLLRETAVVGVVGGSGLGWQLIDSLSSFDWAQVTLLIAIYTTITIVGEALSDRFRQYWLRSNTQNPLNLAFQN